MAKARRKGRRRARRHLRRWKIRIAPTTLALGTIVALAVAAGALLDRRAATVALDELVTHALERGRDPVGLVVSAARAYRVIVLGDVPTSGAPKHFAADVIEALARGPGLDVVVLEVEASLQPFIDAYLHSDPENAAPLLTTPAALGEHWGVSRDYMAIYRRIWRLNQELGPERRIRVVAADLPGWPPRRPLPAPEAARLFAQRDAHMAGIVEDAVLAGAPHARVLVFVSGYHALSRGGGVLEFAGGDEIPVTWLAARLRERHPGEVFSVLVDGGRRPGRSGLADGFTETVAFDLLRERLPRNQPAFALRVDERFDFLDEPIRPVRAPGLTLRVEPEGYRLRDVADAYVYLGIPRGLEMTR